MLQKLGDHIADALERAAAADNRASEAIDPIIRENYERIAQNWRLLARNFEVVENFVENLEQLFVDSGGV
jgi:hypothetical protein